MQEILAFLQQPDVVLHIEAIVLGSARLIIFVSLVPFLGPQLTTPVLLPIILAFYLPLHPYLMTLAEPWDLSTFTGVMTMIALVVKELFIGYILAFVCSCLFYVALSAGTIIDNQRGAAQAMGADPLAGAESSPLGSFMLLAVVTLFFASGAFVNFLNFFYGTYTLWSPFSLLPSLLNANLAIYALDNLDFLMLNAVLVASPFILVALLSDVALGLINRFAPQLNVFILSMPIKSGICALLIIFYLGPFLDHFTDLFGVLIGQLRSLGVILGPTP